jgi:hypothetical protein
MAGDRAGTAPGAFADVEAPFDLAAELHLKFDAVADAYRKAMRELELATSDPVRG